MFLAAAGQQLLPLLVAVGALGALAGCLAVGDRRRGALALWALLTAVVGAVYVSYLVTGMRLQDTLGLELFPVFAAVLLIFVVNMGAIVRVVAWRTPQPP